MDFVRKNLLYLGIVIFVLGIMVVMFAFPSAVSGQLSTPTQKSLLLNSSAIGYAALQLNETGIIETLFTSNSPVDFYFASAAAFSTIQAAGVANGGARLAAVSLEGNGVYEIYKNASKGSFPLSYPNITAPDYLLSNITLLQPGTYYAVFANLNSNTADINLLYASANETRLNAVFGTMSVYGTAALAMFVAGLALIVASFFMKSKQKVQEQVMDEQVRKEYERIEKASGRRKKG